jgi:hypothetical protein
MPIVSYSTCNLHFKIKMKNRWPVPQAYWYNSMLKEDWDKGSKFMEGNATS